MASGTIVGEGGNEVPREKQNFTVTKVYTRRSFKDAKKNGNGVASSGPTTATVQVDENNRAPVPDKNAVEREILIAGSGDTPAVTATVPCDTDVGTTARDALVKTTVPSDDTEKEGDNNHGDNTVQVPELQDHSLVDAVPELEARPLEETVPGPHLLIDAVLEPQVLRLEEKAPEPCDHVLEDAVPEPTACPLENVGPESQACPTEETMPEPEARSLEDTTLVQQQLASCLDAPSDDSTSHKRQQVEAAPSIEEVGAGNWVQNQGVDSRAKINLAAKSKQEKRELRRKLESELDVVRGLVKRIEAKKGQLGFVGYSSLQVYVNDGIDSGVRRVSSDTGSVVVPRETTTPITTPTRRQSMPLSQLSISVMENGQGVGESMEKEKRTPKANQFYRNSEFLLAKDKFPPAESNKKSKLNGKKHGGELGLGFGTNTKVFKNCSALVERLMKHKHGWVFNTPVDVEGLRLHDYYTIIKHPMDLGTIKSRLNKNWYKAPEEFAEDVRLTFHNALTYNPKGQDVHIMAEQLLKIFEEKWAVIKSDYDREMRFTAMYHMGVPTPPPRKASLLPVAPLDMRRILDRSESMTYPSFDVRPKPISTTPSGRTPAPKKPKAKDPHKRDMTYEEKQKLSTNLQSLPLEKLDNIVQIIKKRNSALSQHNDEIEVDIDSVDAETLWELDRFVTNYKKSLSKNKRKAELAMQARAAAEQNGQQKPPASVPVVVEAPKETQTATAEERNVSTSSPVQAEKQGDNGSRSSGSSGSSSDSGSSSSDSDSDSSSASGSDVGH